ncbi:Sodium/proton-potassium antiporter GerN (CPA2 family) OS=Ureibacillus acetophenoni OX=614649 GN=SAMN05877842_11954 PE=3 SV=1 [Ureibacillus acetophenoni]
MHFILTIVIVLLASKIAGQISIRLGQPSVLGKIIAGIVLGPALLGWIHPSELITEFSEIGVLLLMFLAGLETDVKSLNQNMKSAVAVAVMGVVMPIILGWAGGIWFGLTTTESIFLGLVLAATSVSISVQVLRELGWLNSREGAALLGAAVLDDIIVIILIAIAMGFFTGEDANIAMLLGEQVIFFVIIFVLGKWAVPFFVHAFSRFKITEPIVTAALIIIFAFAWGADFFGVSGIIGTYFAGIALARTEWSHQIEEKVSPIAYGIFVPFFFINIGLPISFDGVGDQVWFIVIFCIIAIVSKWIGCGLGARLTGFNTRSSIGIGAGMISRGEVALILASMGLAAGLLPQSHYTSIIIVVIFSTIVTPPLLKMAFGKRDQHAA